MPEAQPLTRVPIPSLAADVKQLAFAEFHRRMEGLGYGELRDGHGCVFRFIDPEGSRLTELAERSGFTKQAVGEVVADLERLGYVERVSDPEDGRAKIIRLNERGRESRELALRVFDELESEWGAALGEERVADLREALESLWELLHRP